MTNTNPDDPYGFENDKLLRNRGFMKSPDCFNSTINKNYSQYNYTARNISASLRRILGVFSFTETTTHDLGLVQMSTGDCLLDYIEFMPVELIETEDTH